MSKRPKLKGRCQGCHAIGARSYKGRDRKKMRLCTECAEVLINFVEERVAQAEAKPTYQQFQEENTHDN